MIQPLIKWPGGKLREFTYIEDLIPSFVRYIEPFFGGGAVFFQIGPHKAIINDLCKELMDFYRFVKGNTTKRNLNTNYMDTWLTGRKYLNT